MSMTFQVEDRYHVIGRGEALCGRSPIDAVTATNLLGLKIEIDGISFLISGVERRGVGEIRKGDAICIFVKPPALGAFAT